MRAPQTPDRPWWMTALAAFCLASVVILVPRDLFLAHTRDVEVWFGFEIHGTAALLTAPLHWAIFLLGAWGFWAQRPWILPGAALYEVYIAASHLIWSEASPNGNGWAIGLAQALAFSIPAVLLWRAHLRVSCRNEPVWMSGPNLLSLFRVVSVPVLLALAWQGSVAVFVLLFALALASDVADGILARRLGQESDFGARLDQWGDFALWAGLPLAAWWLWPEIVRREAPYLVLALACMLLPTAIAYAKYRAVPGYHTWSVKLGAILMGISIPALLFLDFPWPFRIAALFQLVCAADELGITILSPECRNDVPSVFHAAALGRRGTSRSNDPNP